MFGLDDTGDRLNLKNLYYHKSVAERHPNLVPEISYLKDLDDVDTFNISEVDGRKESKQVKVGVDVSAVINYITTFAVNGQPSTVYLALVEGVAYNTIFHDRSCK